MPALKSFSGAGKEQDDDKLCRNPEEAGRFKPEAEKEKDPNQIDEDDSEDGEDDEDVERDEEEEEDEVEAEEEEEEEVEEALEEEEDSKERSQSSSSEEEESDSEFMDIDLENIRMDVQCPICLGIIKKTRTMMECLHRFCRDCIDKSMRLGNNECPSCRKHCASRRSLRDDPNFDAIIAVLFKDREIFEEQELTFHEDDQARQKEIQESIAQVSQRQSEALLKRKSVGKEAAARPQRNGSTSGSRRRRNSRRNMERDNDDDDDDDHDDDDGDNDNSNSNRGKDSSSDDEPRTEIQRRKRKKRSTTTRPSSSNANNSADNDAEEAPHPRRGISPGLAWGRGGTRSSNTRHGNNNHNNNSGGSNSSNTSRSAKKAQRLERLVEYLGSLEGNSVEVDIHLKLVSLDTESLPNLTESYLSCRSTLLVKQLREYVARQVELNAEEIELFVSKGEEDLKDDETLAKLKADYISNDELDLIVMYQQKQIK